MSGGVKLHNGKRKSVGTLGAADILLQMKCLMGDRLPSYSMCHTDRIRVAGCTQNQSHSPKTLVYTLHSRCTLLPPPFMAWCCPVLFSATSISCYVLHHVHIMYV